jgi:hypothetical protein
MARGFWEKRALEVHVPGYGDASVAEKAKKLVAGREAVEVERDFDRVCSVLAERIGGTARCFRHPDDWSPTGSGSWISLPCGLAFGMADNGLSVATEGEIASRIMATAARNDRMLGGGVVQMDDRCAELVSEHFGRVVDAIMTRYEEALACVVPMPVRERTR